MNVIEIEDVGRVVVDETGRPVVVFVPTEVWVDRPKAYSPHFNKEQLQTAIEVRLGWCVAVDLVGIRRGWAALFVKARGRRYTEFAYDDWRTLERDGTADPWRDVVGAPGPQEVLNLRFVTASRVLLVSRTFAEGGALHRRGAALAFSPHEKTLGVVEYSRQSELLVDLLVGLHDLPEVMPLVRT